MPRDPRLSASLAGARDVVLVEDADHGQDERAPQEQRNRQADEEAKSRGQARRSDDRPRVNVSHEAIPLTGAHRARPS